MMRLYIGGCFQGKSDYVQELWNREHPQKSVRVSDGADVSLDHPGQIGILNHYHLLVRRLLEQKQDAWAYTRRLLEQNPDIWIICDEVGMGIVPEDARERRYRETVGRCCCALAKEAGQVERILCGRGLRIK